MLIIALRKKISSFNKRISASLASLQITKISQLYNTRTVNLENSLAYENIVITVCEQAMVYYLCQSISFSIVVATQSLRELWTKWDSAVELEPATMDRGWRKTHSLQVYSTIQKEWRN